MHYIANNERIHSCPENNSGVSTPNVRIRSLVRGTIIYNGVHT